jgi:2-keto-4-pentenoate hydratase/2-oxohepta-3-ene-1,7-dioic acid hydratase in catechol pathway
VKDEIVCLPNLAEEMGKRLPSTLEALISNGIELAEIEKLVEDAGTDILEIASFPLRRARLQAPILKPSKIVCLGLNYEDHAKERGKATPDEPIFFMKPRTTIIGQHDQIVKPSFVSQLDYEAELAVVIGNRAKNVSASGARSFIFGYTILNDVSARDIQFKDKQWTRAKSFDTFAPIGPSITTKNQVRNVCDLKIHTWVNNELRQDSTTAFMAFNVFEVVHHISHVMTLEPCDIISTGTPAGVGFALKPKPQFLQEGDVVVIEIEDLGTLRNTVVNEDQLDS